MNSPKRSEWRVIRELRDDDNFLVVGISKRRRGEYSVRVSRFVERDFAEHLMPHIHVHVRGEEVPEFHEALSALLTRAHEFIQDDVDCDRKRVDRVRTATLSEEYYQGGDRHPE